MKLFDKFITFMNSPMPTWTEIKERRMEKHHPAKYVAQKTIETLSINKNPTLDQCNSAAKTLKDLGEAEKNFTANDPKPKYALGVLRFFTALCCISAITNAEKEDTFPTKAWSFIPRFGDKDD